MPSGNQVASLSPDPNDGHRLKSTVQMNINFRLNSVVHHQLRKKHSAVKPEWYGNYFTSMYGWI